MAIGETSSTLNDELLEVESIIDMMRKCGNQNYSLTYDREKFITMVKVYRDHLKTLSKIIYNHGKD